MKTFNQLTAGDSIFKAYKETMKFDKIVIQQVTIDNIIADYGTKIPRHKESQAQTVEYSRYSDDRRVIWFANETDAMRYCQAQMMKVLFSKIAGAKQAIKDIVDFRHENFQLLNHDWTDREINKLERELR